ncbi:Stp1/IreP family PP2C-type Ser/Thr phosphatase [Oscillospiraceae bacterium OttesenSCG-928-G22]|nr:Stp1/IreP family PP2C-type Ser/Thr phosphatase [Oscillospiraceae bacterium OttesenSCG-928-G22]
MNAWGKTDKGIVRTQNQDAFLIDLMHEEGLGICIVSDGMGGARAGNVASELGAAAFVKSMKDRLRPQTTVRYLTSAIREAVEEANTEVFEKSLSNEAYAGMGTTLVGAVLSGSDVLVANVGDSRAYLISEKGIERMTRDHSVVEDLMILGDLTKEEAKTHPSKHLITRALGTEKDVECDIYHRRVERGQFLLLCSDGLSNAVDEQEILYEVLHGNAKELVPGKLIDLANARGGQDNITVVLLEV